ncbi:hypothetical protein GCM10022267_89020 [Lentzea roselyniae]|uniref:IspG TIM-barrel domain-containing protein n=1 Tax=Lentzea roselyniae TaxID=531940 RepID=A0ABP7CFR9_9PSEU
MAKSKILFIADIRFQPRYVFAVIDAGRVGVRVHPGDIEKSGDKVRETAAAARDRGTPIRIGVNAGSFNLRLLPKHGRGTPEALVESALWEASLFAEHDLHDIKNSVKHHDPQEHKIVETLLAHTTRLAEQADAESAGTGAVVNSTAVDQSPLTSAHSNTHSPQGSAVCGCRYIASCPDAGLTRCR